MNPLEDNIKNWYPYDDEEDYEEHRCDHCTYDGPCEDVCLVQPIEKQRDDWDNWLDLWEREV